MLCGFGRAIASGYFTDKHSNQAITRKLHIIFSPECGRNQRKDSGFVSNDVDFLW